MENRNIEINYYTGSSYDVLYPKTLVDNISGGLNFIEGSYIGNGVKNINGSSKNSLIVTITLPSNFKNKFNNIYDLKFIWFGSDSLGSVFMCGFYHQHGYSSTGCWFNKNNNKLYFCAEMEFMMDYDLIISVTVSNINSNFSETELTNRALILLNQNSYTYKYRIGYTNK